MFASGPLDWSLFLYLSLVQMCDLLGSATPKVDFIRLYSHPQAKPGTFETQMATC